MANLLNLNPAYSYNWVDIIDIIEIQNSLIFNSVNLTNLSQDDKLNSVYIFILAGS